MYNLSLYENPLQRARLAINHTSISLPPLYKQREKEKDSNDGRSYIKKITNSAIETRNHTRLVLTRTY